MGALLLDAVDRLVRLASLGRLALRAGLRILIVRALCHTNLLLFREQQRHTPAQTHDFKNK